ncbi:tRNA (N(6)-L-threonylcarbamoyladenosine(37)-C(2))-methylthiotransferase MtaB [soil metagenome]
MTPADSRYDIVMHTWGCKVNTYDTGLLQSRFKRAGDHVVGSVISTDVTPNASSTRPRVHVLNTCAVTAEASREAAREVRRIKSKEPFAKVVITGCGAQVDGGVFDSLAGADLIVANSHKGQIEELIDRMFKGTLDSKVFRSNIFRKEELEEGGGLEADHTRAFLKIQDGCNSFCSYCVIPFARGKSRSIPVAQLVSRVNELETLGAREIVITGVHIADYEDASSGSGADQVRNLEDLVEAILLKTTIPRIRISSLEPAELSSRLLALYEANPRLCRHFHLSIQSGNTATLARMRRRYTADAVERIFGEIASRLPDAFVGLDLIVGFPGETDEEFEMTYELLARTSWTRIHVFPYSERPGTKALALEGSVPQGTRVRRAALMRELSSQRHRERAEANVGTLKDGLVLSESSKLITRDYWSVRLLKDSVLPKPGAEVKVKMVRFVPAVQGRMDGWFEGQVAT